MHSGFDSTPRRGPGRWFHRVDWTGAAPPPGEAETAVHDAIVRRGLTTFGAVAEHVAAELFARDRERVGALADLGIFRPWYLVIACRAIDGLTGRYLTITPPAALRRPLAI